MSSHLFTGDSPSKTAFTLLLLFCSDRNNGLLKMMQTQGMMERSFLLGTSLYSLVVHFLYAFVFLTLFFGSAIFRNAETPECERDEYGNIYDYDCGDPKFGKK